MEPTLIKQGIAQVHDEGVQSVINAVRRHFVWGIPLGYFSKIQQVRIRYKYGPAAADPWKKLVVAPERITEYRSRGYESVDAYYRGGGTWTAESETSFDRWTDAGEIKSGSWDTNTLPIAELPKYSGIREHFIENVPWKETRMFEFYRNVLEQGYDVDGCESESELLERYQKIESLCTDIINNGYRSRQELCEPGFFACLMGEVVVSIGRDGSLILGDGGGWHRLTATQLFEMDSIPVRVLVRHSEWQKIRKQAFNSASIKELPTSVKPYTTHPDLKDVLPDE